MNKIDTISLMLQALNLELLFQDFNNGDLMQQLKIIIEQNNEILKEIKEWKKS